VNSGLNEPVMSGEWCVRTNQQL